jgi:serine/threonine-protein kinase
MFFFKKKRQEPQQQIVAEEENEDVNQIELELTHVDRYEIIAPIGRGGMGTVYKAIDRERDLTIAIKVLKRFFDLDKRRRKRDYLGREVMIAASLNHPAIVHMHKEIIVQEDLQGHLRRCLLMEYIDGHNLRKHIQDRDLTFRQMIDLSRKLCMGLDFLHQNNIVHRDIKPENFLLTRDMQAVKIVDFGLSKMTTGWFSLWDKEHGGTQSYMSPEQLAKRKLDNRSDIFSFGITMYELFTGQHPCPGGPDKRDRLRQLRSSSFRFEPPSKLNPELPPALDKIILKALRRRPETRYQSVTELLLDLSRIGESRI